MISIFTFRPVKAAMNCVVSCLAVTFLSTPTVVVAQTGAVIEEVMVTATRRETSLQDTGMSLTAMSGFELERQGSTSLLDYGAKVPNLGLNFAGSFGRFTSGSAALRGIRSAGFTGGATGFYIDDVPVPEYMNPHVADVERIEILRGPQGTLFGARSMGGTLRVITKQPNAEEIDGYAHTRIADVKEGGMEWAVDGGVNVPIIKDVLGARAQVYYTDQSGIFDVTHIGPTSPRPAFSQVNNIDDSSIYGGQVSLLWHATDNITITPRFLYQRTDGNGVGYADFTPGNFIQSRHNLVDESGSSEHWMANVTARIGIPWGEIITTTAKYDRSMDEREDMGEAVNALLFQSPPPFGLGVPGTELPSTVLLRTEEKSIIHESRFISDFGDLGLDKVSFSMGVFYEDRELSYRNPNDFPSNYQPGVNADFTNTLNGFLPPAFQIPLPPGALGTDLVFAGDTVLNFEELAVFGELTISLTDNLRLTAGARWSDTETNFFDASEGFASGNFVRTINVPLAGSTQKDTVVNPKVLMELDINDDMMVYASAAKGFRFGGVNRRVPTGFCDAEVAALGLDPDEIATFDSDSIWNYELGAKTAWFNDRLIVNAAVFHINWNDVIQISNLSSCGYGFSDNAGSAENRGFEVEVKAVPFDGLNISMGVGMVDAILQDTVPSASTNAGDRITQIPEWTFSASAEYSWPVFSNWEAYIRGDFSAHTDSISANNASPGVPNRVREGFETLDLRFGGYQAGNWDVSLYVKNATNEHINYSDARPIALEKPGRPRIQTNRPRSFGLELRKYF